MCLDPLLLSVVFSFHDNDIPYGVEIFVQCSAFTPEMSLDVIIFNIKLTSLC